MAKFSANMYDTLAQKLDKVQAHTFAITPPLTSSLVPALPSDPSHALPPQTVMSVSCVDCGAADPKAVVARSLAIFERFVDQVAHTSTHLRDIVS